MYSRQRLDGQWPGAASRSIPWLHQAGLGPAPQRPRCPISIDKGNSGACLAGQAPLPGRLSSGIMPLSFQGRPAAMGAGGSLIAFLLTGGCVGEARVIRASPQTRETARRSTASLWCFVGESEAPEELPSPL